ncbi:hypothetical protein VNO77_03756 [Canavalia gladiata]|uniref:Uncharacterized protein n=1 Tax=Canavalia gladiata TaxID=3824 RepID=A0AAN9R745_CANGL
MASTGMYACHLVGCTKQNSRAQPAGFHWQSRCLHCHSSSRRTYAESDFIRVEHERAVIRELMHYERQRHALFWDPQKLPVIVMLISDIGPMLGSIGIESGVPLARRRSWGEI